MKNRATTLFIRKNCAALSWQRPILFYYGTDDAGFVAFPANGDAAAIFEISFTFAETEMPRMAGWFRGFVFISLEIMLPRSFRFCQ